MTRAGCSRSFVGGSGSARVNLQSGSYKMNIGIGNSWYGPEEAFGNGFNASYIKPIFEGSGDNIFDLKSGYERTITIGSVYDGNVSTQNQDWSSF